ncbi:MAG: RnfH family protein [Coxiella sp. RIFCSPHIGHO2_12_FULL_44_14]|nr:MAG: RnfH family protein [Coxiella sp. RIFCSPHIGHO2_12_FULL_44_14]
MISVTVAYATRDKQVEIPVSIAKNATVALAIRRSGILALFPEIELATATVGIYGRRVVLDDALTTGDRVEIYRPLSVDPKRARVLRAGRTRAKTSPKPGDDHPTRVV